MRHLRIVRVLPCLADPGKIRFASEFDRDVSEIFPYVNATIKGAIYNHAGRTLTLRRDGRLLTLHPKRLEAAKVRDFDDAQALIAWMMDLINDCDDRRLQIDPDFERRDRLSVLDIVKLLPGTNCKKCGFPTCLAFAASLSAEQVSILTCADLFLAQYQEKREDLLGLLQNCGYDVPESFASNVTSPPFAAS